MAAGHEGGGTQRRQRLHLQWRPYRFALTRDMVTSQGAWSERQGWLLRLEAADGRLGWGEAALQPGPGNTPPGGRVRQAEPLGIPAIALPAQLPRQELEQRLPGLPPPLGCAVGMALAELDGLGSAAWGGWLPAPASAILLPAGEAAIAALKQALAEPPAARATPGPPSAVARSAAKLSTASPHRGTPDGLRASPVAMQAGLRAPAARPDQGMQNRPRGVSPPLPSGSARQGPGGRALTVKWKVASTDDALERRVLEALLQRLPADARLRLDANGGWDRATAWGWAERLANEPRLEWLEQPLPADDLAGLEQLATRLPVALDESLRPDPARLPPGWQGWQVRRPLLEGDPRPLLATLWAGTPRLMLSTALETGIGRRLLDHLAGLQALGPTPTAPGLAPGWTPGGPLFASDPATVWEAAQ